MEDFKKFSLYEPTKMKYSDKTTETQRGDGQESVRDVATKFMVEALCKQAENGMQRTKIEQLQAENERLKAENATLLAGIEQLQAENKRLKAENGTRLAKAEQLDSENERLHAENTKLRHLVDDVLHNIRGCKHDPDCGWCDLDECPYDKRACELGIEV